MISKYSNTLLKHLKKRITEPELINWLKIYDYETYLKATNQLITEGYLTPIGAKNNGKYPSFYSKFTISKPDTKGIVKEKVRGLYPQLNFSYYYNRIDEFDKDLPYIENLSDFLYRKKEVLVVPISLNERSYEIFKDEKFLKEHGTRFFNVKLKYPIENLNTYRSREPYFGYVNSISEENYILIIENLDTWYTAKKLFIENQGLQVFGLSFNILIYGEGNKILDSMGFIDETPYGNKKNNLYYWGDIDSEGFVIFIELTNRYPQFNISLLHEAYRKMANGINIENLKASKEQRRIGDYSLLKFDTETENDIRKIINRGKMVPQEILNYRILKDMLKDSK